MEASPRAIIPASASELQYAGVASGSRRRRSHRWIVFLAMCLIACGYLLPLIWMLSTSLKTLDKTMEYPPHFIPDRIEMHAGTPVPEWRSS